MKYSRCLCCLSLHPVFIFSLNFSLISLSSMQFHLEILLSNSPVIMWWCHCSIGSIWHMIILPYWNVFCWLLECRFPPFLQPLFMSLVFFGKSFLFILKYHSTGVQFPDILLSRVPFLVIQKYSGLKTINSSQKFPHFYFSCRSLLQLPGYSVTYYLHVLITFQS